VSTLGDGTTPPAADPATQAAGSESAIPKRYRTTATSGLIT
jgi:hypothetical protein